MQARILQALKNNLPENVYNQAAKLAEDPETTAINAIRILNAVAVIMVTASYLTKPSDDESFSHLLSFASHALNIAMDENTPEVLQNLGVAGNIAGGLLNLAHAALDTSALSRIGNLTNMIVRVGSLYHTGTIMNSATKNGAAMAEIAANVKANQGLVTADAQTAEAEHTGMKKRM